MTRAIAIACFVTVCGFISEMRPLTAADTAPAVSAKNRASVVKVYDVADLMDQSDLKRSRRELLAILSLISPGIQVKETGTPSVVFFSHKGCIVVREDPRIHRDIARVLNELKSSPGDRVPAQVKLAPSSGKEVNVVILTRSKLPSAGKPELENLERDLTHRVAQATEKRFKDNREKIKIVPFGRVKAYLDKKSPSPSEPEVGMHFKADFVIGLDVNTMGFYEGSYRELFRGRTEIMISVFDVAQDAEEGPAYEAVYRTEYPPHGPIDAGGSSVIGFRTLFLDRIAKDMSRYFAAYSSAERLDMK
jgi:hypothetical protein